MFIHYTNSLSAHQLPLDYELVKRLGAENFRYVYTNSSLQHGAQEVEVQEPWIVKRTAGDVEIAKQLEDCEVLLIGGLRPIDLMERRLRAGKATFYMSERWFKPILYYIGHFEIRVPGWIRMLVPSYWRMARRFAKLFEFPQYRYLPIGPHAAKDMLRVVKLCGHAGRVTLPGQADLILNAFLPWGDFVSPSALIPSSQISRPQNLQTSKHQSILYIGRFIKLKHIETIIAAYRQARWQIPELTLSLVGSGPEQAWLKRKASGLTGVTFRPPVSLLEVRKVMREHDLVIFASNGFDGWGAVVQEAMTEGVPVVGTYEAGASAALLPKERLFHCGDYRALAKLLLNPATYTPLPLPAEYSPGVAADRLVGEIRSVRV